MRQEFERHRYVNQIKTTDVLLFNSHQEFQVRYGYTTYPYNHNRELQDRKPEGEERYAGMLTRQQETLNYWKQLTHVLKYFRAEEDPKAKLPNNFIGGFLEVGALRSLQIMGLAVNPD